MPTNTLPSHDAANTSVSTAPAAATAARPPRPGSRRRGLSLVAALLCGLLAMTSGCRTVATNVKSDDAALGRVVVYRNGVAYYERRAHVIGEKLALRVPADKIDDFLKSLTVVDAATGQTLPVSFPSAHGQSGDPGESVEMMVTLPGGGARDVVLTYVTEAPAWKPSYRVAVKDGGKLTLEGWAIVDNTSGEDWKAVRVGVGSSSALSFRFDLHSVRMVERETLHIDDRFAKAPPMGGSLYANRDAPPVVLAELGDKDIPRMPGHPDMADDELKMKREKSSLAAGGRGPASHAGSAASASAPAVHTGDAAKEQERRREEQRLGQIAQSLKAAKKNIVIEGFAEEGEADGQARALDRANNLRNQLILQGVAPAQVQVNARGVVAGQRAGVRLVEDTTKNAAPNDAGAAATPGKDDGNPVGESHFESKTAMTVERGTSAMVSIVNGEAPGEVVYLYDAEAPNGDARYAFRAVRFVNPTDSTLESGPMTVYGDNRFIGEGLSDAIPPHSSAVVPFALDRQIVVERDESQGDRVSRLMKVQRGVLTCEVTHSRTTRLKLTNRSTAASTVLVRHTVTKGWTLAKAPKASEQLGEARLFSVKLGPGEARTLELETTPMTRTLDLRSPVGMDLVRVYLESPQDGAFAADVKSLLALNSEVAKLEESIDSLHERGDELRVRLDELHAQVISLQLVKTGGMLMGHLKTKMKEISQRVQQNTIDIVDNQEKLMIAKVRFQDGVSELTLDHAPPAAATKSPKVAASR